MRQNRNQQTRSSDLFAGVSRSGWSLLLLAAVLSLLVVAPASAGEGETLDEMKAAQGSGVFRLYCGACHGKSGVGDGEIAEMLTVRPANLTEIAKRNKGKFDFEKVRQTVDGRSRVKAHGNSQMPVWGDAFEVADGGNSPEAVAERIDRLTHFIWSIQK
jgi:mono/diheme cytochrome c family protein